MNVLAHHRCHRGPRCVRWQRHPDTGARLGAEINADRGLCEPCTRHLGGALGTLPRDYAELHRVLARIARPGADVVTGTRDLPIPVRADVEALMSEIVHETVCWAESTSDVLGIVMDTQTTRDSRAGVALQRAARILAGAMSVFLALRDVEHVEYAGLVNGVATVLTRDGLDGAVVLLDLHHRVRAVTGQTRLINRLPTPCPRCEYLALERADGDDVIQCRACERVYTWEEYETLCGILADRKEYAA
jgi:hypothetical protein